MCADGHRVDTRDCSGPDMAGHIYMPCLHVWACTCSHASPSTGALVRTISRAEAEPLIKSGELVPSYMYQDDKIKVMVKLTKNLTVVYSYT